MAKNNPPLFSIIIPTLNEEHFLPLLLQDLKEQTLSDFEVIHVDGTSDDATPEISREWQTQLPLTSLTTPRRNVAHQRNLGTTVAKGTWIMYMDADNRIPPFFLSGLKYQLDKQPSIDIFTCWQDSTVQKGSDRPLIYLSNLALESMTKVNPCAPGALIGIRRSVTEQLSFDEEITVSEDHDFVRRVVKAGFLFKVLREPRYIYSLRRYQSTGKLKILRTYAKLQYKVIMGQKVTEPLPEYPMLGGSLYQVPDPQHASPTQLQRLRERLKQIIAIIEES